MGDIEVHFDKAELEARLKRSVTLGPGKIGQAMVGIAQLMIRDASRIAPWASRTLIKSATVAPAEEFGGQITVRLGFGGAASKYAEIQHDKFPHKLKAGRRWHYLIDPVQARASDLEADLIEIVKEL